MIFVINKDKEFEEILEKTKVDKGFLEKCKEQIAKFNLINKSRK